MTIPLSRHKPLLARRGERLRGEGGYDALVEVLLAAP